LIVRAWVPYEVLSKRAARGTKFEIHCSFR